MVLSELSGVDPPGSLSYRDSEEETEATIFDLLDEVAQRRVQSGE